jgi:hypothetical protein
MDRPEREKMLSRELYHPSDPRIQDDLAATARWLARYNASLPEERPSLLRERLGAVGERAEIRPPFFCDYGFNIRLGHGVFLNFNCVILVRSTHVSRLEPASSAVPATARKNDYQDNDDQKGGVVHLEALQHSWSHHTTRVALPRAHPCAAFGLLIVTQPLRQSAGWVGRFAAANDAIAVAIRAGLHVYLPSASFVKTEQEWATADMIRAGTTRTRRPEAPRN